MIGFCYAKVLTFEDWNYPIAGKYGLKAPIRFGLGHPKKQYSVRNG